MSPQNTPDDHGPYAYSPWEIPWKGWKTILLRVKDQIKKDYVSIVAAGVAFFMFLALFPALAAIFSIYGLVVEPAQVEQQLSQVAETLPKETYDMISNILTQTAEKSSGSLSWSLIISLLISLWSANKATSAIFEGMNIAYNETDERGFIKQKAITLGFTLGAIIIGIIAIAVVIAFPAVIDRLGLPDLLRNGLAFLRWIILAGIIYVVILLLYRTAPDRTTPKMMWLTPGALFSTILWIGASLLFTFYMNNFGEYDQTYGSIAAVIILLLWFYLTGFIIILGAELNAQIEHQTNADTTSGTDSPMGQRGAYYADNWAGRKEQFNHPSKF